jgi:SpoVK/Ycf46/Vps4 family AAA+-type ATPase
MQEPPVSLLKMTDNRIVETKAAKAKVHANLVHNKVNFLGKRQAISQDNGLSQAYPHLHDNLEMLIAYLKHSLQSKKKGVNVLIYGAPGIGKTQLTRVVANKLSVPLYEITSEDEDGDPVDGERRLRACQSAQTFFEKAPALMVFDEAEDVFNNGDDFFGKKSTAQTRKAWMNRMLETNPAPTFWLGNRIRNIDPAFIRRFDWVLELPVPPKSHRERIIRTTCASVLAEPDIKRLAACEELAPAVVNRAAQVVTALSGSCLTSKRYFTYPLKRQSLFIFYLLVAILTFSDSICR